MVSTTGPPFGVLCFLSIWFTFIVNAAFMESPPTLVVTVIGTRPQYIKAATLSKELRAKGIFEVLIDTNQHYSDSMSKSQVEALSLNITANLKTTSGTHGHATAEMLKLIEDYMLQLPFSIARSIGCMIVYGDTNSALAAALVGSKLQIPVVHVEAGMRNFDLDTPEEVNRRAIDGVTTYFFPSSPTSLQNLKDENHNRGQVMDRIFYHGSITKDAFLNSYGAALSLYPNIESALGQLKVLSQMKKMHSSSHDSASLTSLHQYVLATVHRPVNTDDADAMKRIFTMFVQVGLPVIWPVHPRNQAQSYMQDLPSNVIAVEPISYLQTLRLLRDSYKLITDSGGLSCEGYWAEKQVLLLRDSTEWVETQRGGWTTPVGNNVEKFTTAWKAEPDASLFDEHMYGDGNAAKGIVSSLLQAAPPLVQQLSNKPPRKLKLLVVTPDLYFHTIGGANIWLMNIALARKYFLLEAQVAIRKSQDSKSRLKIMNEAKWAALGVVFFYAELGTPLGCVRTIIDMNEAHDFDVIITRGKDLAILKAAQSARGDFPISKILPVVYQSPRKEEKLERDQDGKLMIESIGYMSPIDYELHKWEDLKSLKQPILLPPMVEKMFVSEPRSKRPLTRPMTFCYIATVSGFKKDMTLLSSAVDAFATLRKRETKKGVKTEDLPRMIVGGSLWQDAREKGSEMLSSWHQQAGLDLRLKPEGLSFEETLATFRDECDVGLRFNWQPWRPVISTKVLTMGSVGLPMIIDKSSVHEVLFSSAYPLMVVGSEAGGSYYIKQILSAMEAVMSSESLYARASKLVWEGASRYTVDAMAEKLAAFLTPICDPVGGEHRMLPKKNSSFPSMIALISPMLCALAVLLRKRFSKLLPGLRFRSGTSKIASKI